jgi:hypothetical protein
MPQPSAQVTDAEISRIAGVTRATVSNWRRRHDDFPAPPAGNETSPLYDLETVRAWPRSRGQTSAATPAEELRTLLRLHPAGAAPATPLLPLVLATSRRSPRELTELADLPDADLAARADAAVANDATPRHDVSAEERPQVEAAIAANKGVQPPAGTEGRGDALVISIAEEVCGVIISNDNFAPFQKANPWLRDAGRVLGATHSQGVWVFNRRVPNPAAPARQR